MAQATEVRFLPVTLDVSRLTVRHPSLKIGRLHGGCNCSRVLTSFTPVAQSGQSVCLQNRRPFDAVNAGSNPAGCASSILVKPAVMSKLGSRGQGWRGLTNQSIRTGAVGNKEISNGSQGEKKSEAQPGSTPGTAHLWGTEDLTPETGERK